MTVAGIILQESVFYDDIPTIYKSYLVSIETSAQLEEYPGIGTGSIATGKFWPITKPRRQNYEK